MHVQWQRLHRPRRRKFCLPRPVATAVAAAVAAALAAALAAATVTTAFAAATLASAVAASLAAATLAADLRKPWQLRGNRLSKMVPGNKPTHP